jgi:hypothetical protein
MTKSTDSYPSTGHVREVTRPEHIADPRWRGLYRAGGAAALIMVALILVQVTVYVAWHPPAFDGPVLPWFELLQDNQLLGLLSLDFLYLVDSALLAVMYLALYAALRWSSESAMLVGTVLGLVGVAAYYASNTAFEMLYLSNQYAEAAMEAERAAFLAAGEAALAAYRGTAFEVYYVLNDITLLVIAAVMLRSPIFGRATAFAGLIAGVLMTVPSSVGTLGTYMALASLLPWTVFSVLVARRLFRLGRASWEEDASPTIVIASILVEIGWKERTMTTPVLVAYITS